MNTNQGQTESLPVQPGSYTADALAASVEEKFAALFRQVHPPVKAREPHPAFGGKQASETADMIE